MVASPHALASEAGVAALRSGGNALAAAACHGAHIRPRGGAAALTVPGAVSGWWEVHRYSRDTMKSASGWSALLEPAIAGAREGIAVSAGQRRVTLSTAAAPLFAATAPAEV